MKIFAFLFIIAIAMVLRLNLPENKVSSHYVASRGDGFVEEMAKKLIYSDAVADWMYKDFLFVKFACSERMHIELIALPFSKWEMLDDNISQCNGIP